LSKYVQLALELGAKNAKNITIDDLVFDPRTYLKCIGCPDYGQWRCTPNLPNYKEAKEMLTKYEEIVIIHGHDRDEVGRIAREIEKQAFLDGNYFAYALCGCYHCKKCRLSSEGPCVNPEQRRPFCYSLGIDVFKTASQLGLPIQVLKSPENVENRYAFVLIK